MDHASYRRAQEAFVSNHKGTTMSEIIMVTVPLPVALFAYAEFKVRQAPQAGGLPMLSLPHLCVDGLVGRY
jgi:hypothetical protein